MVDVAQEHIPAEGARPTEVSGNVPSAQMIYGAPEGHDARILAERAKALMPADRVLVHVAMDEARMLDLALALRFFAPDVKFARLPAWDCLPYDRVSPHNDVVAQRVNTLSKLIAWQQDKTREPRILLTTVNAIMQRAVPLENLKRRCLIVKKGARLDLEQLQEFFQQNGYLRTDTVRDTGEYAIRGGIIDLYPSGYSEPLRIDLFGDEVDSVKSFDAASQRTKKKLSGIKLQPATEFMLDDESIQRFRSGYRAHFGVIRGEDPLYEAVSEARRYNGMDHWLPLFFEKMDTVLDYVPDAEITIDQHGMQAAQERLAHIEDFYQARVTLKDAAEKQRKHKSKGDVSLSGAVYRPIPPEKLYLAEEEWQGLARKLEVLSPFGAPEGQESQDGHGRKGRDFSDIRALPDGDVFKALAAYVAGKRKDQKNILIVAYSKGSRERLRGLLDHAGFANFKNIDNAEDLKALAFRETGLGILALEHGFDSDDLTVITEQDILGDRLTRKRKKKRKADNFLTEVSSLMPGDLVVHVDHGVGRFESLETLEAAGVMHDCLKIVYDGDDRLFVPVENMEVLSRFGSDSGTVQLDKLGGAGWQARKARVKKDLMKMADDLLKIAAAREYQKAEKLHVDSEMYEEFAARFPYHETEDQQRSINDVLEDLNTPRPMDRLVCGDVGFGKTEVALRAAYVAAMNGTQVAVVVPTTLLARQHYETFIKRFKGLGLRIDQLSRMVTPKEMERTREALRKGDVNIVIGTHALFSKHTKFNNLGLLVVDEEQRFGVKQKERLKELKNNVHILTLTATPIPRTLQMSLSGVRDMSLITTPPVDRLAVRTFVLPFDPVVVREAILREHYRGGQSFYVCPRIKDIEEVQETLKELVPEVKVIAAHGQMSAAELEDRMTAFYEGQYQVLIATNIIENGIDVPSANTMIIHRSDMFGLAQLYQIRGRIGRSKLRAYAYLTYSPDKILTEQAQKRLEVLETLDTLGAGFQLASHDMDIRGAGNLLGEEQSGHVREIGVELYQQMLEEAVAAAREGLGWDEMPEDQWSPQVNIGTSVMIPAHYVEDLSVRMSLYRRLVDLESKEDIDGFAAEMIDRFGDLPDEVENLLNIVSIKQMCRQAGVAEIDAGPKGAVMRFHNNQPPNVEKLMVWMQEKRGAVKLRPDQSLVIVRHWETPTQRVNGVQSLMGQLAGLA